MKPIQSPVITENRHSSQIPHLRRSTQNAFHLPESVELLEKRGAQRHKSGMIVKTVEIVEERRRKKRTGITTATQPCEPRSQSRRCAKASRHLKHDQRVGRAQRAKDGRRKEPDCHET
jgi:hypothetical protein